MKRDMKSQEGFTLFELLAVLVVIAILVGGVLVTREMINASRIRSAISEVEQVNSAVVTFRTKFRALPGDILGSQAQSYGLTSIPFGAYALGYGDGNGKIESAVSSKLQRRVDLANGEILLFWRQLSETRMIPSGIDKFTPTNHEIATATSPRDYEGWMPPLGLRRGVFNYVFGRDTHYFYLAHFDGQTTPSIADATTAGLTRWESRTFDEKIDDSLPRSGRVQAVTNMNVGGPDPDMGAAPASVVCVNNTVTPPVYNEVSFFDRVSCRLQVKSNF